MASTYLFGTTALMVFLGAVSPAVAQNDAAAHATHSGHPASDNGGSPAVSEQHPDLTASETTEAMSSAMMRMMATMSAAGMDATSTAEALRHCAAMQMAMAQAYEAASEDQEAASAPAVQAPAWVEAYRAANERMHSEMDIAFSDDPDVDFARGMIGHHQGAIDMARVVLEYGDDPELRQLAQDVIEAQESEVQFLQDWLETRQQ